MQVSEDYVQKDDGDDVVLGLLYLREVVFVINYPQHVEIGRS